MILQLAISIMPNHININLWKNKCIEYLIFSSACKSDLNNNKIIDGKKAKEWIHGWNYTRRRIFV